MINMNIVIGIILFLLGFIIGVFIKNIIIRIVNINKRIKRSEQIIAEEEKRRNFKEKYDFSDSFDDKKQR
jgi:uncharacterized membrane protein YciS (DUF1049 family)